MPDSQENEWQPIGYITDVEMGPVQETNVDFEEAAAVLRRAADSLQNMRVLSIEVAGRVTELMDSLFPQEIRETQAMAVDIRHGEYPSWDSYGTYWYDPSGFHSDDPHVCFICGRPTGRIDIDFHGAFCNSEECNEVIRLDLERANGGPEQ